jgi:hypothetical protein
VLAAAGHAARGTCSGDISPVTGLFSLLPAVVPDLARPHGPHPAPTLRSTHRPDNSAPASAHLADRSSPAHPISPLPVWAPRLRTFPVPVSCLAGVWCTDTRFLTEPQLFYGTQLLSNRLDRLHSLVALYCLPSDSQHNPRTANRCRSWEVADTSWGCPGALGWSYLPMQLRLKQNQTTALPATLEVAFDSLCGVNLHSLSCPIRSVDIHHRVAKALHVADLEGEKGLAQTAVTRWIKQRILSAIGRISAPLVQASNAEDSRNHSPILSILASRPDNSSQRSPRRAWYPSVGRQIS